jgi:hypothetical protein
MSSSLKNKKVEEWRTRKILMKRFKELLKRLLKKRNFRANYFGTSGKTVERIS